MSKFKVGDRVRRINNEHAGVEVGQVTRISEVHPDGYKLEAQTRPAWRHQPDNLELVADEPVVYKVGDKVRRIRPGVRSIPSYQVGYEFTVASVDRDGDVYDFTGEFHGKRNVELVVAAPAAVADPFGIKVATVQKVEAGDFVTTATNASVNWREQDSDGDLYVTIDGQWMKPADLRQAADLFKALADKLEASTK